MAIRLSGNSYGQLLGIWAILHETKRGQVTITKQILKITNILVDVVPWVGSLGWSKPLHSIASNCCQVCTCGEGVDVNQARLANPDKTVMAWKLWYGSCSYFRMSTQWKWLHVICTFIVFFAQRFGEHRRYGNRPGATFNSVYNWSKTCHSHCWRQQSWSETFC